MSMQINKMCRTCLVSDTPLVPLFNNKTEKNASVIEMLQACNFFPPSQVCYYCNKSNFNIKNYTSTSIN